MRTQSLGAAPVVIPLLCGMVAAEERVALRDWANAALFRQAPVPAARPGLDVRRQDYGKFGLRQSVMNTPLQIGQKKYERGLGTHAVSEIVVRLPEPGKAFTADVGVDNNYDTKGEKGTVTFSVEVAGKEAFKSSLCRGGQAPVLVQVDLNGAREFVLRVGNGGDGPEYDQADWAQAVVTTQDGKTLFLDDLPVISQSSTLSTALPFSFVYGGKSSVELLANWKREEKAEPLQDGVERRVITWSDPATGLEVTCDVRLFANYPAIDWVLCFRNGGNADTPLLERILPLDLSITAPAGDVTLHHSHGSTCTETDYLPLDQKVGPNGHISLAPNGGRSSDGRLPFYNLAWADGGLVGAIGWSGQWALNLHRDASQHVTLQMGQQTSRFALQPGERVRTPRNVLVLWKGSDRLRGHNLLRRLILDHYAQRLDGQPALPPVTQNTWFVFAEGNKTTEQNQLEVIAAMAPLGVECYWLDAGWFEGSWPAGAGSWVPKKDAYPNGLKPLGDAAHERTMKFVLWFEPERVTPQSRIAKEHPEWVLRAGGGDGLFNLGDPAARQWLTDFLCKCIADWGIDIYRNDFNIDPLRFWSSADKPGREGISEIRYIEGLYTMWDDLHKRSPGLLIDDCASGGRRIDIEMVMRSYPLWRSDTQCGGKPQPVWDQVQTAGLSLYVPLHSAGVWSFDPYPMRSVATTGMNLCMNTLGKEFSAELAARGIKEVKALRPYYLGDYYPLTEIVLGEHGWCGWQFDRPELGGGFAMFFRRAQSRYTGLEAQLRGLDPDATYEVSFFETFDLKEKKALKGAELAKLPVSIATAPGSLLVMYKKAAK
ncbi:MAG: alpha-galactosidase [Planctomycetota bacterium]|nr:alpha-galactosidase [Planctomycetota bacterium]